MRFALTCAATVLIALLFYHHPLSSSRWPHTDTYTLFRRKRAAPLLGSDGRKGPIFETGRPPGSGFARSSTNKSIDELVPSQKARPFGGLAGRFENRNSQSS